MLRGSVPIYVTPKVGEDPHWQDEHVEIIEGSKGVRLLIDSLDTYSEYSLWIDVGSIYDSKFKASKDDLLRLEAEFIKVWGDRDHPEFYT